MSQEAWFSIFKNAITDVWCYEDGGEFVDFFMQKWDINDPKIFLKVMEEGSPDERIFMIFALGYLVLPDATAFLVPFLQSSDRKERWASAISLGRLKETLVLPVIQEMLLDNIIPLDFDNQEYNWYMYHRLTVATILGNWNKTEAVPSLRHAMETCSKLELQSPSYSEYWWHPFLDRLAYALGQLRDWEALYNLNLSPCHFHVALIYLILGSLRLELPPEKLFIPELVIAIFEESDSLMRERLENLYAPLHIKPEPVMAILEQRFSFSKAEQINYIQQFGQVYIQRNAEDIIA